ncbi:hypothetical protein [Pseudorhodoferax sp.]|uniref:hypothetical protein n=1 Tax=Pseudorhodoferax sp. TaxID=1993553 RepID=UPI0039E50494
MHSIPRFTLPRPVALPRWPWVVCAAALVAHAGLPPAWWGPPAPPSPTVAALASGSDSLDWLRSDAAIQAPYAAMALTAALLDRFEAGGDSQALFEAMLVLDQHWDRPDFLASGLIQRVVERHCPTALQLRRFWLCEAGE